MKIRGIEGAPVKGGAFFCGGEMRMRRGGLGWGVGVCESSVPGLRLLQAGKVLTGPKTRSVLPIPDRRRRYVSCFFEKAGIVAGVMWD